MEFHIFASEHRSTIVLGWCEFEWTNGEEEGRELQLQFSYNSSLLSLFSLTAGSPQSELGNSP